MWGRINQTEGIKQSQVDVALAAVVGFLVVEIATRTVISMAYVGGAFVAAAVLIGPATPLGGVAGLVIHDAFHGAIGYWSIATVAWILVFAWVCVWLATGQDRQGRKSTHRAAPAYAGIIMIGGVNATAFAAWLMMILGVQRFYTAAIGFLPGVIAAVGFCLFGLVAVGIAEHLDWLRGRRDARGPSVFESELLEPYREPTGAMTVGVFIIGSGWLFGVSALDVFVHDLQLYPTANEFSAFVTGFLGSGSPIATVGTTVLLSVYNYGELAVIISAPAAVVAMLWWCTYHEQVRSSTGHVAEIIHGVVFND